MAWSCFLITPTDVAYHTAQRRGRGDACPADGTGLTHYAQAPIGDAPIILTPDGYQDTVPVDIHASIWASIQTCACGYVFTPDDGYAILQDRWYVDAPGSRYRMHGTGATAPPAGALWEAPWSGEIGDEWNGPDGKSWMIRLPDGTDWNIDGPSRSGGRWTRTGTLPHFTVRPSILSRGYHGWFTEGILSNDIEGRTYGN